MSTYTMEAAQWLQTHDPSDFSLWGYRPPGRYGDDFHPIHLTVHIVHGWAVARVVESYHERDMCSGLLALVTRVFFRPLCPQEEYERERCSRAQEAQEARRLELLHVLSDLVGEAFETLEDETLERAAYAALQAEEHWAWWEDDLDTRLERDDDVVALWMS